MINDIYGKTKRRKNLPENIERKYQLGIQTKEFEKYLTKLQEEIKNSTYLVLENKESDLKNLIEAAEEFGFSAEFNKEELEKYSEKGVLNQNSFLYKLFLDQIKEKQR